MEFLQIAGEDAAVLEIDVRQEKPNKWDSCFIIDELNFLNIDCL